MDYFRLISHISLIIFAMLLNHVFFFSILLFFKTLFHIPDKLSLSKKFNYFLKAIDFYVFFIPFKRIKKLLRKK